MDEKTYSTLSKVKTAELTQELSMKIINQELRLAGGNAFNLHPDSAEWCLLEPATKLFTDTRSKLLDLVKAAKAEGLSHSVSLSKTGEPVAIAISPNVNDSFVAESEAKQCA